MGTLIKLAHVSRPESEPGGVLGKTLLGCPTIWTDGRKGLKQEDRTHANTPKFDILEEENQK